MAFPVILVNSATGSDTAASGAGPTPAISGTANAATDAAGTTVTLPAGTDLTNVATDGSHVVYINDATAGARNFGKITAKAGSGGATPTVTVSDAFGINLTAKDWAIGGVRSSLGGTNSKKLAENNGAAGDAMPGWVIEWQSGHSETFASGWTVRRSGDTTSGPIVFRGTFGAGTLPLLNHSANATFINFANAIQYVQLRDFEYRNTNATKTASVAINASAGTANLIVVERVKIADATNRPWRGISIGNFGCTFDIRRCEIANTADSGIVLFNSTNPPTTIRSCRIHNCGNHGIFVNSGGNNGCRIVDNEIFSNTGDGINRDTGTGVNGIYLIERNTIYANGSDGIDWGSPAATPSTYTGLQFVNNILANNAVYGLNLSGTGMTAAAWNAGGNLTAGNQTFSNSSGGCNLSGILTGDSQLDPQFNSSTDLRIGSNLRSQGYPTDNNLGTTYRTYINPGANQPSAKQPATTNVRNLVSYADGTLTGNLVLPSANHVRTPDGFGANGTEFTGNEVLPAANVVLAPNQFGANGNEFTGTAALTAPPVPVMSILDNANGTGATATITGSDPASHNRVYFGDPNTPENTPIGFAFSAERIGDGTLICPVSAGKWIFRVVSVLSGVTSIGTEEYETVTGGGPPGILDNADGTGLTVTVSGSDPTAIYTVEIQDTTTGTWVDGPNRTGSGSMAVPAGTQPGQVVIGRTYFVRIRNLISGVTSWTQNTTVTPTAAYDSDVFRMLIAVKHRLLNHPLYRIGNNVVLTHDPNQSIKAVPNLPAVFVWQAAAEVRADTRSDAGGPNKAGRTGWDVPIEVVIADSFDVNDVSYLQWWLAVRKQVVDLFDRQPVTDDVSGYQRPGRKWKVTPGPLGPVDQQQYEYRTQSLVIMTEIERTIGG